MKSHLFIVGCPRSGTTLVQSLLSAHTDVAAFTESHLFDVLYCKRGYFRDAIYFKVRCRLKAFCQENDLEFNMPIECITYPQISSYFLSLFNQKNDKSIILEKTPSNVFYIKNIQSLIKGARFIHVHRNSEDTIASLYNVHQRYSEWGGSLTIEQTVDKYLRYHNESIGYMNQHIHYHLDYDMLVKNPEKELVKLCNWYNMPFQEKMLELYSKQGHLIRDGEVWKRRVRCPIYKSSSYFSLFDQKTKKYIRKRLKEDKHTG